MTSSTTLPAGFHADQEHDPEQYWRLTKDSYPHYPTIRHRQRFLRNVLRRQGLNEHSFIFEYGCGSGAALGHVRDCFGLRPDQVGGCDIAETAIELSRQALGSPYLYVSTAPPLPRSADVVICTEVLEHTTKYEKIIEWSWDHLVPGGAFVVTTQAGRIHASDRYTGHTQHFRLGELKALLRRLNFTIEQARCWGWPLFTLQKYLTNVNFQAVRQGFLEGGLTLKKRLVFGLAYALYYLHDLIPYGPQIYIVARKPK